MNTRIEKDFYFLTGIHLEDAFFVNNYAITLSMLVETDSIYEQNIALDRLDHFLNGVLQNSVLVDGSKTEVIEKYRQAGLKICEIPDQPYDQVFSLVLIQKLNAITENRLKITDLMMGSMLNDDVRFTSVAETAESALSGDHWWNKSSICLSSSEAFPTIESGNIVKLFDDSHWTDVGLGWKSKGKK